MNDDAKKLIAAVSEISALCEQLVESREHIEMLQAALQRIMRWSEAYPIEVFPEPDWKKAAAVLKAGGMSLDSISAACMRHVTADVDKIVRTALCSKETALTARIEALEAALEQIILASQEAVAIQIARAVLDKEKPQ